MNINQTHAAMPMELPPEITAAVDGKINEFKKEQIEHVANEFESVFLSMMLKEMRNTLDQKEGGLFGGEGSDSFGGMFDLFMGQHLAASQPLGIADAVRSYLGNDPEQASSENQSSDQDKSK